MNPSMIRVILQVGTHFHPGLVVSQLNFDFAGFKVKDLSSVGEADIFISCAATFS